MGDVPVKMWLSEALPDGVREVLERLEGTPGVVRVAVMPDVHLAGEFCVGAVVAAEGMLFPNAVGGDIGCGMLALAFDGAAETLADEGRAARMLGALAAACPGRRHHRRTAPTMCEELRHMTMSDARLESRKNSDEARLQLGTLGAGNHFLELQADADGRLWLMIHTGSRHLGQCVLHHYLPMAQRLASGVMALESQSEPGRGYLHDVGVARAWARENRRLLAMAAAGEVERILGFNTSGVICDCDHNHVQEEVHEGLEVLVHRKGATVAADGVAGIVPGSMGTPSFHTLGRGCAAAIDSSSHGAGRALSRTQARARITIPALRQQLHGVWYDARIERQLREEAPAAYKDVERVMHSQAELTQVVRRLRPVLVYKGV